MDRVVFKGSGDRFGNYGPEINRALKECAGKSVLYIEKGVYPTGRFTVIKREAAARIFDGINPDIGKAFLESSVFTQIFCRTE